MLAKYSAKKEPFGQLVPGLITKVTPDDIWPLRLRTVTEAKPEAAMSAAGMLAVKRVELTKVVVRGEPFHWTPAPETKLAPSAVSVKAGPPALAVLGVRLCRLGIWGGPCAQFNM